AAESQELRKLPTVKPAQAEAALRGATERLGTNARLTLQGDRATLTLSGVPGEALAAWLGEVRSAARARPDEAKLSHGPNGYSGSVLLTLPRPG
ncbi:MAG: type II secretion system protein GspM, partial [Methylibium sp.]|nr:type II secretion system protein GspM [Methylibium sp.]